MNDQAWYFVEGQNRSGPVTRAQIEDLVRSGRVSGATQVWTESFPGWLPVSQTELAALLAPVHREPPPFPNAPVADNWSTPVAAASYDRARGVSFGEAISLFWRKYVVFSGRASRSEYWYAILGLIVAGIVCTILDAIIFGAGPDEFGVFGAILNLAVLLPSLSILSRRLHDTDRSAWWMLFVLVPLVGVITLIIFVCQRGTPGPNRFGP